MSQRQRPALTIKQLKPLIDKGARHIRRQLKDGHLLGRPVEAFLAYGDDPQAGPQWSVVVDTLRADHQELARNLYPKLFEPTPPELPLPVEKRRAHRSDIGKRRFKISGKVDRALRTGGLTDDGLRELADFAQRAFLGVWGDQLGCQNVLDATQPTIEAEARKLGFRGTDAELQAIMSSIPNHVIGRTRAKGKAGRRRGKDAAEDNNRGPHIRRNWTEIPAGAVIFIDGSIGDVLYRSDDGSERTAKLIQLQDGGSGFCELYPVFCSKGAGTRGAETALGFCLFVTKHRTVPGWTYCDNGPENAVFQAPLFEDLSRAGWSDESLGLDPSRLPARRIVHSLVGRPASRSVEPGFRVIKDACRDLPGFIDSDRMRKPTQTLMRPTRAVLSEDELSSVLAERIDHINHRPMDRLGGRSRAEVWAERPRHDIDFIDLQTGFEPG